jgi:dihydrofolate reductase
MLVRAMIADRLIDELHLFVFPLALGAGERLLADGTQARFALVASDAFESGVLHLTCRLADSPGLTSDHSQPR